MLQKIIPLTIGKYLQAKAIIAPKKAIHEAFNIFCTPRKGKSTKKHQEFFDTSLEERIETNEHQIQTYTWAGENKTILLLHGWESNSYRWKNLILELQKSNYNIIAVDAPGQGNSSGKYLSVPLYTECVKDIIDTQKPSVIIGHSLGGMTAVYQQIKYLNPCVEKLIALGPPSELSFFLKSYQQTIGVSDNFMKKFDDYLKNRFGFYSKEFSIARFAKEIKIKGLLILEKNDKLAPYKYSKKIADNWKDCELYTVDGIGHSLQSDDINKKIIEYINE